jgi:DNA-binding transcriptional ArsR family regulator
VEFKVTLDREAFKVLASDTRLDILKALDERPMTVSELGRKLELNKATVFEHLEKLASAGLVKKQDDDERKWVYYSLSWKARRILHPERVTIALLFSSSLAAMLSGVVVAAEYLRQVAPPLPPSAPGDAERAGIAATPPAEGDPQPMAGAADSAAQKGVEEGAALAAQAAADPALLYVAIALFATVAVLLAIGAWYWKQAKARDAREAAESHRRGAPPAMPPGA